MGVEEGHHLRSQPGVVGVVPEVSRALFGGQLEGGREQCLYARPAVNRHEFPSSRLSHAREKSQSRFTVATEMPRAWAVSSSDSPAKQRHSTTRHYRSLWASRRASASSRAT